MSVKSFYHKTMNNYYYNEPMPPNVYSNGTIIAVPGQYGFSSGLDENIYPSPCCPANNVRYFEDNSQEIISVRSAMNYASFPAETTCHSSPQSHSTQSPLDMPYQLGENMADYFIVASPTPSFLQMAAPIKVESYNYDYRQHQQAESFNNYLLSKQDMFDAIVIEEKPNCYAQSKKISVNNKDSLAIDTTNSINISNTTTTTITTTAKIQDKQPKETSNDTPKEEPKKVHACDYCHRSFARKYDVARHKRIHTGSKPYACPCCPKAFARSDARVRHFRSEIACRDGANKLRRIRKSN